MRAYVILDTTGAAYRSIATEDGQRLVSVHGTQMHDEFRRERGAATVFASLSAARKAVQKELAYRYRHVDVWTENNISAWYATVRIVRVEVKRG
jgi:hypothetical protein